MGRKKLSMELIAKEKARNVTFKKRKEGLIRKMHEFTTLCDVSACMIIYGPKQELGRNVEPDVWPPHNNGEVQRIIQLYKSKNKDSGNKTYTLSDFFHERKRKVEDELVKLKKKNLESKYPTKISENTEWKEKDFRDFAAELAFRIELVKSRIEVLKMGRNGLMGNPLMDHVRVNPSHIYPPGLVEMVNPQAMVFPPPLHHQYQLHHHPNPNSMELNPNSMMRLLTNDHSSSSSNNNSNSVVNYDHRHFMQFGNSSNASGNMQFKREVVLEHNPISLGHYYAPPHMLSQVPIQRQPYVVAAQPMSHHVSEDNNNNIRREDLFQMQMMKKSAGRFIE